MCANSISDREAGLAAGEVEAVAGRAAAMGDQHPVAGVRRTAVPTVRGLAEGVEILRQGSAGLLEVQDLLELDLPGTAIESLGVVFRFSCGFSGFVVGVELLQPGELALELFLHSRVILFPM